MAVTTKKLIADAPIRVYVIGPRLKQRGGIATLQRLMLDFAPEDLVIKHIGSHDDGSIPLRLWLFVSAYMRVLWALVRRDLDIAHIHQSDGGSLARKSIILMTVKLFGRSVILHGNGAEPDKTVAGLPVPLQQLVRRAFTSADFVMAVNNYWAQWYLDELGIDADRLAVLANPAPPIEPAARPSDDRPCRIVSLGRLGERKGTFDLIRAFAAATAEDPTSATLVIAGDGEVDSARSLAASLEADDRISIPGWLSSEDCREILKSSHAFALFSHAEGLPLAMQEALAHGLPVLTSPNSGIDEVVVHGENGLLAAAGNVIGLTNCLETAIGNPDLLRSLGAGALETAKAHQIEMYWESIIRIYTGLSTS